MEVLHSGVGAAVNKPDHGEFYEFHAIERDRDRREHRRWLHHVRALVDVADNDARVGALEPAAGPIDDQGEPGCTLAIGENIQPHPKSDHAFEVVGPGQ